MDNAAKLADIAKLEQLTAQDPRWGVAEDPAQFTAPYLNQIGITAPRQVIGNGYIKLFYTDFIVEEITTDGQIVSTVLDQTVPHPTLPADGKAVPKFEATIIKQAFGTFEAIEALAEALGIERSAITYAGLKDGRALTSQLVSFNLPDAARLQALKIPNIIIKDIYPRVGMRNTGELWGNRFTILVRTGQAIDPTALAAAVNRIKTGGFWNFYSLQRFGGRLQAHQIGQLILTGRHEDALRLFLCGNSPHESRIFQSLRAQAAQSWGNWPTMIQVFSQFPFFMEKEIRSLNALAQTNGDIAAGLAAVADQTKIAVAAFGSYHFNALLSKKIASGSVPERLAMLGPRSIEQYSAELGPDAFAGVRYQQPGLAFLGENRAKDVATRCQATIHSATSVAEGVIFHFDLPKAAYATSLLSELFDLYQNRPVPDWVNQAEVDTRAPLGYPPVTQTTSQFLAGDNAGLAEE